MNTWYILFFCYLSVSLSQSDLLENNWKLPHAWGYDNDFETDVLTDVNKNNKDTDRISEIKAVEIFYVKLVNYLFNESKMKIDKTTNKLSRIVHIEITKEELEIIKSLKNMRTADSIIMNVLKDSNDGIIFSTAELVFSWSERISLFFSDTLSIDDFKFSIYIICGVIIILLVKRKYNYNIFWIFFVLIVLISYLSSYRNCNKRKQMEQLVQLSENSRKNPCEFKTPLTIWEKFTSYIWTNQKIECVDHLMKVHVTQSDFCDPLEHLNEFVSFYVYKNVENMFVNIGSVISGILSKTGFPYNIIAVVVLLFCFKDIIIACIQFTFKYIIAQGIFGGPNVKNDNIKTKPLTDSEHSKPIINAYKDLADTQHSLIKTLIRKQKPKKNTKTKLNNRIEDILPAEENESCCDTSSSETEIIQDKNVKLKKSSSSPDITIKTLKSN